MLIYDGKYADVSEQAIISCMTNRHLSCCKGAYEWEAYKFIMNHGAVSEACMPYEGSYEPICRINECTIIGNNILGYEFMSHNINTIKEALLRGPVSTGFEVYAYFYDYVGGCYQPASSTYMGMRGVVVIGWDDRQCGGEGAWICKNSWGTDWGMGGYFYIKYGTCNFGSITTQIIYEPSEVLLDVRAPDGGECFVAGSEIDIAWVASREREQPDYYNVYLSMDGGGLYDIPVAEGLATNDPITFQLPTKTGTASILVTGILEGAIGGMDTSDEAFTIALDNEQPFIQVLSPSGGEVCHEGDVLEIEWIATDNAAVASIDLFYSTNRVNTISIAYGEENDSHYDWVIPPLDFDSLYIRIVARDVNGLYSIATSEGPFYLREVSTDAENEVRPGYVNRLEQNYPNPFNGTTTIAYSVAGRCKVEVRIYDTSGRLVSVLERAVREPGRYETVWRGVDDGGREMASGVYYCRVDTGAFRETRKIVYLR